MKRIKSVACGLIVGAFVLMTAWAAERQGKSLPTWAQALISTEFSGAEIISVDREGDDEDRYEVKLKWREKGQSLSVDLTEDAGIVEIDEELKENQLPERVTRGLRRAFPKAQIKRAEKNTDISVAYSIDIVAEGKKREVRISPKGRILEIEKRD